jgi:hypothetical protein
MFPGQGEGEAESATNFGSNIVRARQGAGSWLENAPLPPGTPYGIPLITHTLGGLLNSPDMSEQLRENDARLQEAYRQAGAVTPQQQSMFRMTHTEFMDPLGQQLTGFLGNTYGVNPNRLNLWHGVRRTGATDAIRNEGFTRGRSAEIHAPGTSMSSDPNLSYSGFAENDVNQMLRARANVDPTQVRNYSPGEYSASRLPEFQPEQFRATSKPQSYYREAELFFPQASGGQASLTDIRPLTIPEVIYLRGMNNARSETNAALADYGRRTRMTRENPGDLSPNELRELAENAPTLAEGLLLMQRQANQVTRAGRPSIPRETASVANRALEIPPYSQRLMFPEASRAVDWYRMEGQRLADLYNQQRDLGRSIASTAGGTEGMTPSPTLTRRREVLQQRMDQQTGQYREFSRGNDQLIGRLQGLQVSPADAINQRLTMRDMIRASGQEGGRPFYDVAEALAPVMQRLGYTPAEITRALRDPASNALAGRSTAHAARVLAERRYPLPGDR